MDIKQIKTLIDLMRRNDLSVFKMETEGVKIVLKKETGYAPLVSTQQPQQYAAPQAPSPGPSAAPESAAEQSGGKEIVSPMVGTFYESPSPESPAYVSVGQEVTPDTVVCIVEAMKVMNEIKAEVAGTITEILAESGKPVQYGQALFRLK